MVITMFENFVEYWWTGADWTTDKSKAAVYQTEQAAHEEMRRIDMKRAYQISAS